MPYAPALSNGSPVARYSAISESVSARNVTRLSTGSPARIVALRAIANAVTTIWERPESIRSIRRASSGEVGFSKIRSSHTTIVSAPITIASGTRSETARAFSVAIRSA
jgi:hypothetical protein